MFQRLKGFNLDSFLDTKIAEEQAKQRQTNQSPNQRAASGPAGTARQSSARTDSPGKRTGSRLRVPEGGDGSAVGKGPDPSEFVIDDDSEAPSRATTPLPMKEGAADPGVEKASPEKQLDGAGDDGEKGKGKENEAAPSDELPEDVRKKLQRLDKLEARYHDLLKNYRTAHARVAAIEPFEASLRENTPLTSINEPGALVEYLSQLNLKGEMVMDELKRVSGENQELIKERDELKIKLEDAEKKTKEAYDEAAGLKKEREGKAESPAHNGTPDRPNDTEEVAKDKDPRPVNGVTAISSPPAEVAAHQTQQDETFFSYETELPRLEAEVKQQADFINELSTENATLRQDLDMCQLDLSAANNKVRIANAESANVKKDLDDALERERVKTEESDQVTETLVSTEGEVVNLQNKLKDYQHSLDESNKELEAKAQAAEENLKKYQKEHEENLRKGTYETREAKRMETLNNLVKTLKDQLKQAEDAKKDTESDVQKLEEDMQRLKTELRVSEEAANRSKSHEEAAASLRRQLALAETERSEALRLAETKKGHETQVANMKGQLRKAERDRDSAYQMIINCGKCHVPDPEEPEEAAPQTPTNESSATPGTRSRGGSEATEATEASTQPTEISTPSVEGDSAPATAKKSKKKKSKAKKKASVDVSGSADGDSPQPVNNVVNLLKKSQLSDKATGVSTPLNMEILKQTLADAQTKSESEADEQRELIRHHEGVIEERDAEIRTLRHAIGQKEEAIERLDKKLKGEEDLVEEVEHLRDELIEIGKQATDAKHEKQQLERRMKQMEANEAQARVHTVDQLNAACDERDELRRKIQVLETAEEASIRSVNAQASSTLSNTQEKLESLQKDHDTLGTAKSEAEKKIEDLEKRIEELEASHHEKLQSLETQKEALRTAKEACEKQIEELEARHAANSTELDDKHKKFTADFNELRAKTSSLDTDLALANQLAQTRFKELTDLRDHLNKMQPELKQLREGSVELKKVKEELSTTTASVKKLESKERDLRSEIAEYKSQVTSKDAEIQSLNDKETQGNERSSALEETCSKAQKDLQRTEGEHKDVIETRDRLESDLKKAHEELKTSKASLGDLERKVQKFGDEARTLREELQVKSAKEESAQSYMNSVQDQNHELVTQMKEVRGRCESLDEDLADANRMLSERSREAETMRRLLSEVEGRAETKAKEMRERMDLAVEERDRAEDEASSIGRRKAREIEDVKNRLRDAERESSRATEAREDAERRERDFRSKHADLEGRAEQAQEELAEVRSAMAQLRDALDESERQASSLEREKAELRKSIEEKEARLERLQKSAKVMADELRTLQTVNKNRQGSLASSRSSLESSRVTLPAPRPGKGTIAATGGPEAKEAVDYVYLKNVLLQFLEQREKKHQMQLVPVLGRLLHFDKKDEQKWMAAVTGR